MACETCTTNQEIIARLQSLVKDLSDRCRLLELVAKQRRRKRRARRVVTLAHSPAAFTDADSSALEESREHKAPIAAPNARVSLADATDPCPFGKIALSPIPRRMSGDVIIVEDQENNADNSSPDILRYVTEELHRLITTTSMELGKQTVACDPTGVLSDPLSSGNPSNPSAASTAKPFAMFDATPMRKISFVGSPAASQYTAGKSCPNTSGGTTDNTVCLKAEILVGDNQLVARTPEAVRVGKQIQAARDKVVPELLPQMRSDTTLNSRHDLIAKPCFEWLANEAAAYCQNPCCKTDFGIFQRRHHCRLCGGVYCGSCTQRQLPLTNKTTGATSLMKVCSPCFAGAKGLPAATLSWASPRRTSTHAAGGVAPSGPLIKTHMSKTQLARQTFIVHADDPAELPPRDVEVIHNADGSSKLKLACRTVVRVAHAKVSAPRRW